MNSINRFTLLVCLFITSLSLSGQLVEGVDFEVDLLDLNNDPAVRSNMDSHIEVDGGIIGFFDGMFPFFKDELFFYDGENTRLIYATKNVTFAFITPLNGGAIVKATNVGGPGFRYYFVHPAIEGLTELDINAFQFSMPNVVESTGNFVFLGSDSKLRSTNGSDGIVRTLLTEVSRSNNGFPVTLGGKSVVISNNDLYITDGTFSGTTNLTNDRINGPPTSFCVTEDHLFFEFDNQFYASQGTVETTTPLLSRGLFTNAFDYYCTPLVNGLVFIGETTANGRELWFSDGTEAGTTMIKEFVPGPDDGITISSADNIISVGNNAIFKAYDENGLEAIWVTDGTTEGTYPLETPGIPRSEHEGSFLTDGLPVTTDGDAYFYLRNDGLTKTYIYGTNINTLDGFIVTDSFPGRYFPSTGVDLGDRLLLCNTFFINRCFSLEGPGLPPTELGNFDDLNGYGFSHNGIAYFSTESDNLSDTLNVGEGIFRSDGTLEGTYLILDPFPGPSHRLGTQFFLHENEVHIYANNDLEIESVYVTDGTVAGTRLKTDLFDNTLSSNIDDLKTAGKKIIIEGPWGITAFDPTDGTFQELPFLTSFSEYINISSDRYVVSDRNDILIAEFGNGPVNVENRLLNTSNLLEHHTVYDNNLFFVTSSDFNSEERAIHFIKLDTNTGSLDTLSTTTYTGPFTFPFPEIVSTSSGLLYVIPGENGFKELWKSDGSMEGTERVATLFLLQNMLMISEPTFVNNQFFFTERRDFSERLITVTPDGIGVVAYDIPDGEVVFDVTDLNGKTLVRTNRSILQYNAPNDLSVVSETSGSSFFDFSSTEKLFLVVQDSMQLWRTDGTPENTKLLTTLWDERSDGRTDIAIANNKILVTTRIDFEERLLVYDINTDDNYVLTWEDGSLSDFENAIFHQGKFYITALNDEYGNELHSLDFNLRQSISGITYHDANQNNEADPDETLLPNIRVLADGLTRELTFSNEVGHYAHYLLPGADYTVSTIDAPCWELSTTPIDYTVTADRDTTYTVNFGFQPLEGAASLRPLLSMARPRCGFTIPAWITLYNDGCEDLDYTSVAITLPEGVTFVSADSPPTITDNTLSWVPGALSTSASYVIHLELKMPGEEANGENIAINLHSSGIYDFDISVESNFIFNQPLSCAIDPNDKQVTPSRAEPSNSNYTQNDETLTYTIRFQNTGTDTAFNVRLEDQLSDQLDHLTFKPIAASHDYRASMDETGLVKVFFDNIMLPDSNVNQTLSNGFFSFDVNARPALDDFTTIDNTVGIFFDFNRPVITNTISSTIVEFIDEDEDGFPFYEECDDENPDINPDRYDIPGNGIDEDCNDVDTPVSTISPLSGQLSIFPNPAHQQVNLTFSDNRELVVQLYDLFGRAHAHLVFRNNASLSLDKLPAGTYLLKVTDALKGETNIQRLIRR